MYVLWVCGDAGFLNTKKTPPSLCLSLSLTQRHRHQFRAGRQPHAPKQGGQRHTRSGWRAHQGGGLDCGERVGCEGRFSVGRALRFCGRSFPRRPPLSLTCQPVHGELGVCGVFRGTRGSTVGAACDASARVTPRAKRRARRSVTKKRGASFFTCQRAARSPPKHPQPGNKQNEYTATHEQKETTRSRRAQTQQRKRGGAASLYSRRPYFLSSSHLFTAQTAAAAAWTRASPRRPRPPPCGCPPGQRPVQPTPPPRPRKSRGWVPPC